MNADNLKKRIEELDYNTKNSERQEGGNEILHFYMPMIIDDEPTIDVYSRDENGKRNVFAPVVHGKWEWANDEPNNIDLVCTVCKGIQDYGHCRYCPNCGAKMDGGASNESKATPKKCGKWLLRGDYAKCSICSGSSGTQYDGVEPVPNTTAYCPHCGTKMYENSDNEVDKN